MEAIAYVGGARASSRILLLHPDPEFLAGVPVPEGWELYGLARPDAVSSIGERDDGTVLWLVHETLIAAARPTGPALLIGEGEGPVPAPYLGRISTAWLARGLLAPLLPQVLGRWRAEQALANNREQLDFHRWHDPGTALPNPLLFREHLHRLVVRARRLGIDLALIQIDLLGLRREVPTGGQLRAIAAALRRAGGVANPAGRGDACDFQLAISDLPHGPLAERRLAATMDRAVQLLRDAWPANGGRARMGVARLTGEISDADALEQAAADARREAWRSGRNWVDAVTVDRLTSAFRADVLLTQLTDRMLVPIVQPVVRIHDGGLISAEVLLRSWDGANGLVPPACSLHALDDLELVQSIGRQVRRRALGWLSAYPCCPRLAVNLAPSELEAGLLAELRCAPAALRSRLTLELTEGALDGRPGQQQVIADLASTGLRLSVDDFGTGHAALERLRGGHFHQLKLDRCFVTDVVGSRVDQAIAASTLELGNRLGLSVVAEGVETEAQRRKLQELGYRTAQGYLFDRPMPFALFRARYLDPVRLTADSQ
jgi:EAL domain-containing protein (putative c-di-GMP-specific phosphodiesterase class I)